MAREMACAILSVLTSFPVDPALLFKTITDKSSLQPVLVGTSCLPVTATCLGLDAVVVVVVVVVVPVSTTPNTAAPPVLLLLLLILVAVVVVVVVVASGDSSLQ